VTLANRDVKWKCCARLTNPWSSRTSRDVKHRRMNWTGTATLPLHVLELATDTIMS